MSAFVPDPHRVSVFDLWKKKIILRQGKKKKAEELLNFTKVSESLGLFWFV